MRTYLFMTMYCGLFFKLLSVWDWLLVPFAISACARHCMTVMRKPYKYNGSCAYANGFPVLTWRLGIILTSPTSGNTRSSQYPIQWALMVLPWGLHQLRHEVNHSPPPTSKVKNESSCTFTPPICLHCKGRNNFAFPLHRSCTLYNRYVGFDTRAHAPGNLAFECFPVLLVNTVHWCQFRLHEVKIGFDQATV